MDRRGFVYGLLMPPVVPARLRRAPDPAAVRLRLTRDARDAGIWIIIVVAGLLLTAAAVAVRARLGTASPPFTGEYRLTLDLGSLLAPVVAASVLVGVRRGVHERLPWGRLLAVGFLTAFTWAVALAVVEGGNGLARPLELPRSSTHDVAAVGSDPIGFLRTYVEQAAELTVDSRQHPPGGVLLLWALDRVGVRAPAVLGLLITAIGCAAVPLVATAVRSFCGEAVARQLVPVLALAPYAVWVAVSLDAVPLAVCAAALTCGVVGSEPRRSPWWAVAAGGLLGTGALFSYSVAWLGASLIVTYFVRRRPLLNVLSGAAALVPLGLLRATGFVWPDGLTAAQVDFSVRIGPHRSWLLWVLLDVLLVAIACGPAIVAAARKLRRTAAWPMLVGAMLAVGFAIASGLSRGEVERSFLPFFPWLLVPAVAPEARGSAAPVPTVSIALGAAAAVTIEAILRTAW